MLEVWILERNVVWLQNVELLASVYHTSHHLVAQAKDHEIREETGAVKKRQNKFVRLKLRSRESLCFEWSVSKCLEHEKYERRWRNLRVSPTFARQSSKLSNQSNRFEHVYHPHNFGSISWHDWHERECKKRRPRALERTMWLRNDIAYGLVR